MDEIQTNNIQNKELNTENKPKSAENNIALGSNGLSIVKKRGFQKGDLRINRTGRPLGSKNFSKLFDVAIKKISKSEKLNLKDPEIELIVRGIVEALKGNYSFYRDILDRRFGKPKETIDVQGGQLPVILEISRGKDRNFEGPENDQK